MSKFLHPFLLPRLLKFSGRPRSSWYPWSSLNLFLFCHVSAWKPHPRISICDHFSCVSLKNKNSHRRFSRNLMNYSYSLGIHSCWFCVTPYKMVLTFKSVDANLMWDHSNAVQGDFTFYVSEWNPNMRPLKLKLLSNTFM